MSYKSILVIIVSLLFVVSCKQNNSYKKINEVNSQQVSVEKSSVKKFVVNEFLDAGGYTYLKVTEGIEEYWMAIPPTKVEIGKTYYYSGGMFMENFESKTLKKTFDKIKFVERISESNSGVVAKSSAKAHQNSGKSDLTVAGSKIEKASGELKLSDIFKNKNSFANTNVEIKGIVVKVNKKILDRNWIHIVDGTKLGDKSSLTITSEEMAEVGDTLVFKGKIVLDKDFGYNYVYDILLEDGKILK
ncbi:hypothetical protein R3X25_12270 [Lutibacter sp. TH_r2]|uniref:hypothetical protein n=1 Tax=Lutibacter sp. TH_r2 TaxID=3082083 RepID=UPI0029549DBD|nr:hypothetical protein [Lutibacter sp. TH_r2]MDV7188060.1 hypothetical protein [Lutibacter sp. TH_r2]